MAKSTLSQLEAGTGNPSVETLWSLGVALGVPFSRLVEPPAPQRTGDPSRRGPAAALRAGRLHRHAAGRRFAPHPRRDIYVIELEPGRPRDAEAHMPGSVEHVVVAAGRLPAGPIGEPVELAPGDYIAFPGDVPHRYEALEPGTWAVLVMEHR